MGKKNILFIFFFETKSIQMVILAQPWEDFFLMALNSHLNIPR